MKSKLFIKFSDVSIIKQIFIEVPTYKGSKYKIKNTDVKKTENAFKASPDFLKLVLYSGKIVDKSQFIEKIFQYNQENILLTYPNGWGKSINLTMLKLFLEKSKNAEFRKCLFKGGCVRYEADALKIPNSLEISESDVFEEFGKYQVIYLDFKKFQYTPAIQETIENCVIQVIRTHINLFARYDIEEKDTNDTIKKKLKNFGVNAICGLEVLCKNMFENDDEMPYILIDDYYKLVHHFYGEGKEGKKTIDSVLDIFWSQFDAKNYKKLIVTNDSLNTYFGKEKNLFFNKSSSYFNDFFGFNDTETKALLNHFKVNIDEEKLSKFFDGYSKCYPNITIAYTIQSKVDNQLTYYTDQDLIYQPLKDLLEFVVLPFDIKPFFQIKDFNININNLICGMNLECAKHHEENKSKALFKIIDLTTGYKESKKEELLQNLPFIYDILFDYGFLVQENSVGSSLDELINDVNMKVTYKIPNALIRKYFSIKQKDYILESYQYRDILDLNEASKLISNIMDIDIYISEEEAVKIARNKIQELIDYFQEAFDNYCFGKISDVNPNEKRASPINHLNEDIIHSIFTAIVFFEWHTDEKGSDVRLESSGCKPDLLFLKDSSHSLIIEVKYGAYSSAWKGVDQIILKGYQTELMYSYPNMILIGIHANFKGDDEVILTFSHEVYHDKIRMEMLKNKKAQKKEAEEGKDNKSDEDSKGHSGDGEEVKDFDDKEIDKNETDNLGVKGENDN
jgi:hypothetical protein